ncbi:MAG: phage integrase family protein [Arthrobacter sp.]|nr:phage integrase family protein [Arthrobacter sp.]
MSRTKRKAGQLGPQVEGYQAWLAKRGYTTGTIRNMLKDLGQVGLWLSAEGLRPENLDEERMAAFLSAQRGLGRSRSPGPRALVPLLRYLREIGVAPGAAPLLTPLGALLTQYRSWLIQERGLAPTTVLRYENIARRLLEESSACGAAAPADLTGADINAFLLREFARVSAGSAKGRVVELRSILRFPYLQDITELSLGAAVPAVGGWRFATRRTRPPAPWAGACRCRIRCPRAAWTGRPARPAAGPADQIRCRAGGQHPGLDEARKRRGHHQHRGRVRLAPADGQRIMREPGVALDLEPRLVDQTVGRIRSGVFRPDRGDLRPEQ